MEFGAQTRIVIERRDTQDHMWLYRSLSKQVSSTISAELSELARRRLERSQVFPTSFDPEVLAQYSGRRRERACMSLTAGYAVTMPNRHVELIDFVSDISAQAAAA
ncbi:conserved hypothetical protein [Hyphomicrobiales bacterium]|nr:conserved hypothetical protein [Hyphomicrobiales bacterium]CAH1675386.1 conserved hypothetical protein [Hyphomicrobiales bacterium]